MVEEPWKGNPLFVVAGACLFAVWTAELYSVILIQGDDANSPNGLQRGNPLSNDLVGGSWVPQLAIQRRA